MTLRDEVRATLDGDGVDALDDIGDVPADLVGTALGHFADTAPLADADALAPIVTAASPVPFDPELDGVGGPVRVDGPPTEDAHTDPDDFDRSETVDEGDVDPGDFDDVPATDDVSGDDTSADDHSDQSDTAANADDDETDGSRAAGDEHDFGAGQAADELVDDGIEPIDSSVPADEPFAVQDESFDPTDIDTFDDEASAFEPVVIDDLDVDPSDDFDAID